MNNSIDKSKTEAADFRTSAINIGHFGHKIPPNILLLDHTKSVLSFGFTCAGVLSFCWPVTGLNKHLLSVSLDHVNIFADLLESHLKE